MITLHMVELRPNLAALLRFLSDQGLGPHEGDEDLGYGIHAWLTAAFGDLAPKPWRLLLDRRRPPRILGYALADAEALREHLHSFADPGVFAVLTDPAAAVASKPMPSWRPGRRLAFELQCCPVGRKSASGVEKDLFLIEADRAGDRALNRETVYCAWARERLQRDQASEVTDIHLAGFRLIKLMRQGHSRDGQRQQSYLIRPQALLRGHLVVGNAEAFTRVLAHGIGRHRAFGYGMLLLRPAI